jgi:hypothetical protein
VRGLRFVIVVAAMLVCAAPAHAGVVRVGVDDFEPDPHCGNAQVQYVDTVGDANHLVVDRTKYGFTTATDDTRFCGLTGPSVPLDSRTEDLSGRLRIEDLAAGMTAEAPCEVNAEVALASTAGARTASVATCPNAHYNSTLISTGAGDDTIVIRGVLLAAPAVRCGDGADSVVAPVGVVRELIADDCETVVWLPPYPPI